MRSRSQVNDLEMRPLTGKSQPAPLERKRGSSSSSSTGMTGFLPGRILPKLLSSTGGSGPAPGSIVSAASALTSLPYYHHHSSHSSSAAAASSAAPSHGAPLSSSLHGVAASAHHKTPSFPSVSAASASSSSSSWLSLMSRKREAAAMTQRRSSHRHHHHHPSSYANNSSPTSSSHHPSAAFHVQMPTRMLFYTAAVFLVLPVLLFLWKELHLRHLHQNDLLEPQPLVSSSSSSLRGGQPVLHSRFPSWMSAAAEAAGLGERDDLPSADGAAAKKEEGPRPLGSDMDPPLPQKPIPPTLQLVVEPGHLTLPLNVTTPLNLSSAKNTSTSSSSTEQVLSPSTNLTTTSTGSITTGAPPSTGAPPVRGEGLPGRQEAAPSPGEGASTGDTMV